MQRYPTGYAKLMREGRQSPRFSVGFSSENASSKGIAKWDI
jgi:hypothetical protein